MSQNGTVRATVSTGAVTDSLGNPSFASSSADNEVTYQISGTGTQPSSGGGGGSLDWLSLTVLTLGLFRKGKARSTNVAGRSDTRLGGYVGIPL